MSHKVGADNLVSGHVGDAARCPLSGVKRTLLKHRGMSAGAAIAASHLLPAAGPPAVTIKPPFRDRAKAVTLICREAVEQPHAAGALKPILATVARGM